MASDDVLGGIYFNGDDGTGFKRAAFIETRVDATPGANDIPGRLTFSTSADGSATPTERMRITSAGNVGIGTTTPNQLLSLRGATGTTRTRMELYGDGNHRFFVYSNPKTGAQEGGIGQGGYVEMSSGGVLSGTKSFAGFDSYNLLLSNEVSKGFHFVKQAAGSTVTDGAISELMTISSAGNVGINQANPKATLDIMGLGSGAAPATTGTADPTMNLRVSRGSVGVDTGMLDNGTGYTQVRSISNLATTYNLALQPTGGNVGIGAAAPNGRVEVSNTVAQSAVRVFNAQSGAGDGLWIQNSGGSGRALALHQQNSSGDILHAYYDGGGGYAIRMALNNAGGLWVAGGLTQNSDINMKKDIVEIPDALEKLSRLRGVSLERPAARLNTAAWPHCPGSGT